MKPNVLFDNSSVFSVKIRIPNSASYADWIVFSSLVDTSKARWSLFLDISRKEIYFEQQNPRRYVYLRPVVAVDDTLEISVSAFKVCVNGNEYKTFEDSDLSCLPSFRNNATTHQLHLYSLKQTSNEKLQIDLVPCLDNTGTPCMFDLVTRKPFYNSGTGEFIVGIENQAQLDNLLRKLPDRTGQDVGTLQVQLADELQTPENEAKLDAMLAKNWEISQAA